MSTFHSPTKCHSKLRTSIAAPPSHLPLTVAHPHTAGVYVSAHWCGPCRTFTPTLLKFYDEAREKGLEIVFISCDHSDASFQEYYSTMPWQTLPYDDEETRVSTGAWPNGGVAYRGVLRNEHQPPPVTIKYAEGRCYGAS